MRRTFKGILAWMLVFMGVAMIAACGGGGSEYNPYPTPPKVEVGSVQLLASSTQVGTDGQAIEITAIVKNKNGVLVKDAPVTFRTDTGTLQVLRGVTDEAGTALAKLSVGTDRSNRNIAVSASAGEVSGNITVMASGTRVVINGPSNLSVGERVNYSLVVQDSAARGIPNQDVTLTSTAGSVQPGVVRTNAVGEASFALMASQNGVLGASVGALNATGQKSVAVAAQKIEFIAPASQSLLALNTNHPVTIRLSESGSPLVGASVAFSTSRGSITSSVVTDSEGKATAQLSSNTSGPAIITASYAGVAVQHEVQMVATVPATIILQADPTVVSVGESSMLVAMVRDAAQNPVQGAQVNFNLTDVTGGRLSASQAVTDAQGRAQVVYTAGSMTSADNGVVVTASVAGTAISDTESLTVGNKSLFITVGAGHFISDEEPFYRFNVGLIVTDARGAPVANQNIPLRVIPNGYFKGYWVRGTPWERVQTAACMNEDFDRDGILDAGEDFNGNTRLDPGNVVTLSSSTVRTDSNGLASVQIIYAKQYATWIEVDVTATALVAGSESRGSARFPLPIPGEAISDPNISPPGNPSPFGQSTSCGNSL